MTVAGSGGVGKTTLAVHWAHQIADRFPDGQLYVNLRGHAPTAPRQPADVLQQFLRALGIGPDRIPPDVEEAAALYRSQLADKRVLIILDNAGDGQPGPPPAARQSGLPRPDHQPRPAHRPGRAGRGPTGRPRPADTAGEQWATRPDPRRRADRGRRPRPRPGWPSSVATSRWRYGSSRPTWWRTRTPPSRPRSTHSWSATGCRRSGSTATPRTASPRPSTCPTTGSTARRAGSSGWRA